MSRQFIDVNDAIRHLRGKCVAKYPNSFLIGIFAAADELKQLPTIDAAEVVRCKDCTEHNHCELEKRLGWYGYCSEGKRK